MTAPIRLLVERGQLLVGGDVFPGHATPDGGLWVGGHDVRPLSLAERGQLLAVVAGPGAADRLSRLIGVLAAPSTHAVDPSTHEIDERLRAAVEAVALYLAGAAMSGPLARTTLLVTRATGRGAGDVGSMGALEADRLADAIGAGLGAAEPVDDIATGEGWTTISFEPATAIPDAAGDGAVAVRDRLAARLLARDAQVLPRDLLDQLLDAERRSDHAVEGGDPAGGGTSQGSVTTSGSGRGSAVQASGDRWTPPPTSGTVSGTPPPRDPAAGPDRWTTQPGTAPDPGADRWRGRVAASPSTPAAHAAHTRPPPGTDGARHGRVHEPGTASPHPGSAGDATETSRSAAGDAGSSTDPHHGGGHVPVPQPGEPPRIGPSTARTSPAIDPTGPSRSAGDAERASSSGWSEPRTRASRPTPGGGPEPGLRRATSPVPAPRAPVEPRPAGERAWDPTAVARALERTADLRGLRP